MILGGDGSFSSHRAYTTLWVQLGSSARAPGRLPPLLTLARGSKKGKGSVLIVTSLVELAGKNIGSWSLGSELSLPTSLQPVSNFHARSCVAAAL